MRRWRRGRRPEAPDLLIVNGWRGVFPLHVEENQASRPVSGQSPVRAALTVFSAGGGQLTQLQSASRSESLSLSRIFPGAIAGAVSLADHPIAESPPTSHIKVPHYLTAHYWWAYVHPRAVWVFERQWLVNLILWGNFARLRNGAMAELGSVLPGATLQVACVYGDLTGKLIDRVSAGCGRLD